MHAITGVRFEPSGQVLLCTIRFVFWIPDSRLTIPDSVRQVPHLTSHLLILPICQANDYRAQSVPNGCESLCVCGNISLFRYHAYK